MKKNLLITIGLLIAITAFSQQQPENPGFEDWEDVGLNVDEPVNWSSLKTSNDPGINFVAPYVWDKSTDFHTGTYSVKLYNSSVLGIVAASLLIGIVMHIGVWKISSQWQDAIVFLILFVFLLLKPVGFKGQKSKKASV